MSFLSKLGIQTFFVLVLLHFCTSVASNVYASEYDGLQRITLLCPSLRSSSGLVSSFPGSFSYRSYTGFFFSSPMGTRLPLVQEIAFRQFALFEKDSQYPGYGFEFQTRARFFYNLPLDSNNRNAFIVQQLSLARVWMKWFSLGIFTNYRFYESDGSAFSLGPMVSFNFVSDPSTNLGISFKAGFLDERYVSAKLSVGFKLQVGFAMTFEATYFWGDNQPARETFLILFGAGFDIHWEI